MLWAFVGDYLEGVFSQPSRGAVYVYELCGVNWFLNDKIIFPGDGVAGAFGVTIAARDDLVLIGAPGDDGNGAGGSGSAWLYERQGKSWVLNTQIEASDPSVGAGFGQKVATDGVTLLIGAPGDDSVISGGRSAYVFELENDAWTETAKLVPSELGVGDGFGAGVAVEGSFVFVGATGDDDRGLGAGAIYVFEKTSAGWIEVDKIFGNDTDLSDRLGSILFVRDGVLAAGSPIHLDLTTPGGTVYVFQYDGQAWVEVADLSSSDGNLIGSAVAVQGNTLVAGALNSNPSGAVYVFQDMGAGWIETAKLEPRNGLGAGNFGTSIALDGDTLLVGSDDDDVRVSQDDLGAAYTISLSQTNCPSLSATPDTISVVDGGVQVLNLKPGSPFAESFYWVVGSLSGVDPGFTIANTRVPINIDDYFALSLIPNPASPLLFSMGVLPASGSAQARVTIAPGADTSLVGLVFNHAFVTYELGGFQVSSVSNPVELLLEP